MRPNYCPCKEETPEPCPACGATINGDDPVRGVCQARYGYKAPPILFFVLEDKKTGQIVASQPVL